MSLLSEALDKGVLDRDVHEPLLRNIAEYCSQANIPKRMVYASAADYLTEEALKSVVSLFSKNDDGIAGVVFTGEVLPSVDDCFAAIVGMCLRNFIDGRVWTASKIIAEEKEQHDNKPSVIVVPNFFLSKLQGGHQSSWDISTLMGFLTDRYAAEKHTILYVSKMKNLQQEYGAAFFDHLNAHYIIL